LQRTIYIVPSDLPSPPNLLTTTTTSEIIKMITTTPNSAKYVVEFVKKLIIPLDTLLIIAAVPLEAAEPAVDILEDWIAPSITNVTMPIIANERRTIINAFTVFKPKMDFLVKLLSFIN
jgi:hypothetical protein